MAILKNLIVNGVARVIGDLTASKIIKQGGISSQFLKADGSVDSTSYYHSGNKPSLSDLGAAAAEHTHNYLPLSGGTITGIITGNTGNGLIIQSANAGGAWNQGLRIYPASNDYSTMSLQSSDSKNVFAMVANVSSHVAYFDYCKDGENKQIQMPYKSGTIALTSDIPNVTNYYWANIPISATSNTAASPTFNNVTTNGYLTFGYTGAYITSDIRNSWRTNIYGDTTNYSRLRTVRTEITIDNFSEIYGSGLTWATGDTQGYLSVSYYSGSAWIGGGNGDNLNWSTYLVTGKNIGSQSVSYANSAGTADTSSYPAGFNLRQTSTWATTGWNMPGTWITGWGTDSGADIAFAKNGGALNVATDGYFYQGADYGHGLVRVMDDWDRQNTIWSNADYATSAGSASSASKWSDARKITLTGSVTGEVSIDGSGDVSLVTTTNHTHNYLPLSGGTITGDLSLNQYLKINAWSGYGSGSANLWYNGNTNTLQWQNTKNMLLGSNTVLHSSNYNSYSPTLTGDGASGTWKINITGKSGQVIVNSTSLNVNYNLLFHDYDTIYRSIGVSVTVNPYTGNISAGHFYANSDIRYKNITDQYYSLSSQIAQLPIFKYTWINREDSSQHIGSSAQSVMSIIPELVSYDNNTDFYSLDYATLGAVAGISACREVEILKQRIQDLEQEIIFLKSKYNG